MDNRQSYFTVNNRKNLDAFLTVDKLSTVQVSVPPPRLRKEY